MYYFNSINGKFCYELKYWEAQLSKEIPEITLYEAKREIGSDWAFCTEYNEAVEVKQGCGKDCSYYKPRNGKNGRCRFSQHIYSVTKKTKTIRL